MTQIRFVVTGTVDEELLEEHNGSNETARSGDGEERYPLEADPERWNWDDLKAAIEDELVTDVEAQAWA